jgi:azurin
MIVASMNSKSLVLVLALVWAAFFVHAENPPHLELKPGDHVALIGNTLADRFQHSGWLETYTYARYPDYNLVFRNLAVSGDEITIRARSENFGTPDEWLTKVHADVIFAFFGFNESFKGHAGIEAFKANLDSWLKETRAKNFSGKGHPRIVLFSPIANEKNRDPNFPDPAANNANLLEYTEAMAAVARSNGVPFIDLYHPSLELYANAARQGQSLTINGIHLSENGDNLVAQEIFKQLFGETPSMNPEFKGASLEKLRTAINEKNEVWHSRYRTIDGYNVFGGRSALAYAPGQGKYITDRNPPAPFISNFKVMQEEMSQRDVMTANRDQRIWAVAKGGDLKVEDTNLPPVTKVPTDLPGTKPDKTYAYLGGEEGIAKMTVHSHMKVNLFASEEMFPELANPVQMAWDTKGRLWVAVWRNYPERTPTSKVGDSVIILDDTKGVGKADKVTVFIDDLNAPTGFQFYKDGVLLMQAPDLWYVGGFKDNKAEGLERVLMGMDSADSHHTANSICLDPGGAVYLSDGVFHRSQVETANGPVRNLDAAIYRFEPRTGKFDRYASYGFANPHGRVFNYWGDDIITDATGNNSYFAPAFSGHIDYPEKHPHMKDFWDRPSRPCAGTGLISSRHFPDDLQGDFLDCNVISFQGIYLVKVSEDGSGLKGETQEPLVSSSDGNFRPSAVNIGPDGAIYFADWHKPLIGHMQHHLRDPNREHEHGRIYRITYEGRPLLERAKIDGEPVSALLELLKAPENSTRERAKVELGKHDSAEVIAAVDRWAANLDAKDPAYEHNMMEALWVHQWHNVVNTDLLARMLHSPEPHARAAAGRVLCYWRDRVPDALARFKTLADDENPRVRLEAVRDASFFTSADAADVAITALKHPTDYYLDYTLRETIKQLEPWWRQAISAGQPVGGDNPDGLKYLLGSVSVNEILKLPRTMAVNEIILDRSDAQDPDRLAALLQIAKERHTSRVAELLTRYGSKTESNSNADDSLARLLPWQLPAELKPERSRLANFTTSTSAELRQTAWVTMALADNSFDAVWTEAAKSPRSLADLLNGISKLPDSDFRAQVYERVKPLLNDPALRRPAIHALVSMHHEPEAVFTALTDLIAKGQDVPAAAKGLRIIPRASWPKEEATKAATGLVAWAKTVPTGERTSEDYIGIVQFAEDLAGLMPAESASALRHELSTLRVPIFMIRTVREQMRYDTPRVVVEAGKPFEIRIENDDFMPHNLVIVKPGKREKVGLESANMKPDQLDKKGRPYVPKTSDILNATTLLNPGQKAALKLTAPEKEGDYEYVCTFPGHYQNMWGQLIVTRDVDAYLAAHPQVTLPAAAASAGKHDHQHSVYE